MPHDDSPLSILMVQDTPWRRTLGASRVQMEIGEELSALGHHVEHYSVDEAEAGATRSSSPLDRWRIAPHFATSAVPYVRANSARFDVIDALVGCLPASKADLGFTGALVARSVALYAPYFAFERQKNKRWPSQREGTIIGQTRMELIFRRDTRLAEDSLRHCDIANVCNTEDADFVRDTLGYREKTATLPLGIGRARCHEFAAAAAPQDERRANREVVFVGAWTPRKGSLDWGEIVAGVRRRIPDARFLFLGTGKDAATVRADLKTPEDADWVRIVPKYDSERLPALIASGTVGAFPSYIDAFGIGILEKLASGIPTVAYNVSGPREILKDLDPMLLTPSGKPAAFADRLSDLLELSQTDRYADLAARSRETALKFTWDVIARRTLQLYQAALAGQPTPAAVSSEWDGRQDSRSAAR